MFVGNLPIVINPGTNIITTYMWKVPTGQALPADLPLTYTIYMVPAMGRGLVMDEKREWWEHWLLFPRRSRRTKFILDFLTFALVMALFLLAAMDGGNLWLSK